MNFKGKHIMVVDDTILNLQITASILKTESFLLSLAQDGYSALSQLEKQTPDLILLNIMMPGIGLLPHQKQRKTERNSNNFSHRQKSNRRHGRGLFGRRR